MSEMAQTRSAGSPHLDRVHHHRNSVAAARAALTEAAAQTVAAHYDQERAAAPPEPTPDLSGVPSPGVAAATTSNERG